MRHLITHLASLCYMCLALSVPQRDPPHLPLRPTQQLTGPLLPTAVLRLLPCLHPAEAAAHHACQLLRRGGGHPGRMEHVGEPWVCLSRCALPGGNNYPPAAITFPWTSGPAPLPTPASHPSSHLCRSWWALAIWLTWPERRQTPAPRSPSTCTFSW